MTFDMFNRNPNPNRKQLVANYCFELFTNSQTHRHIASVFVYYFLKETAK